MKQRILARPAPWRWRLRLAGWLAILLLRSAGTWAQGLPLPLKRLVVVRDSLGHLLATQTRPDTLRATRLNTLAFVLRTNDPQRAQELAWQGLALARRLHFAPGLVESQFTLGYLHRARSQYDSAIYYSRQALVWAIRTRNSYTQTRAYYNLCRIYTEQGNYAAALGPSLDGLTLARTIHNSKAEVLQLVQAGRIELGLGEYDLAISYIEEARRLLPAARDTVCTGFVFLGLGDIRRQQQQWAAARRAYTRTLGAYRVVYNDRGLLPVQLYIAEMTERLGDYRAARLAGQTLLRRARTIGNPEQLAQASLLLARTWLPTRPDSARHYAALSLATAAPRHLLPLARDAAHALASASDQLGQSRAAYRYQLLATAYADTLSGEDARRRLAAAQARAARSRTQTQLRLLQQQEQLRRRSHQVERLLARQQLMGTVGAAVALLLLGGWLFWQYRRRAAQRLAARDAALRQRLAADLHDDVGNLLTQISLQSDLLRETNPQSPPQLLAHLQALSDTSRRATRQMADVVWGLHVAPDSLPALLTHMRDHAYQVLPPAGLAIDFGVTPEVPTLHPSAEVNQSLYLIYKECLHNAVKHAHGASRVVVRLSYEAGLLYLRVRDDAPSTAAAPGRPGGQGLRNMRQRAEAVGGTFRAGAESTGFGVEVGLPV